MLYLILLLPLAMAALSLVKSDRVRTVLLTAGQLLLLALLILACTLGDTATPVWHMTADLTFSLRLDGLGRFFCLLTAVCWLLTIPYAAVYMTHEGHHPRFYVFLMLTEAALPRKHRTHGSAGRRLFVDHAFDPGQPAPAGRRSARLSRTRP